MEAINGLFVYTFEHDDDLQGWIPVESFRYSWPSGPHGEPGQEALSPAYIEKLRTTLKECGWEGDGELGAMMVPPFFSVNGYSRWFPVFHVKQSNNGTSWIASESELSVENLNADSRDFYEDSLKASRKK